MLLLLAAAVPILFWDSPPDTAPALRDAGIRQIAVPPGRLAAWQGVEGVAAQPADPQTAVKLLGPTVNYRMNEASATNAPWVVANGWKIIRRPQQRYYYEVAGKQAGIAAAEAFAYGANALVKADAAGLKPLAAMLDFLRGIEPDSPPPVADIGYIDDGSPASGEVMNLLTRDNLLFRVVPAPDRSLKINVKLGAKEYPVEDAKNPGKLARMVRYQLTDEKRSLRVYGSQVVVGRLMASGNRARVHLLNYAGASRVVNGVRVRVLGRYPEHRVYVAESDGAQLLDYTVEADATEFTVPQLRNYAVIDLSR
jgi:hypothetical protein